MPESRRVHLLVVGDVVESVGTRSYLREMIRYLRLAGVDTRVHMFQFRLNGKMPAGDNHIDDFDERVFVASGAKWFGCLPRPFYRLYERLVLLRFLRRTMRQIKADDALVASGCLGGVHLLGSRMPADAWWLKLGLIEEEGGGTLRFRVRKWIESMHARRFRNRIIVSEPMGGFVDSEYGEAAGEQLVLPCLVDLEKFPSVADRQALRRSLGLDDRLIVAYVGTAAPWQCAAETVALFEQLIELVPDAFFWVFTPDQDRFRALLTHIPEENWRLEFCPHHELAAYLSAADVGCLLRHRTIVNRVASPLKFPEYLACGLPVLIGPEVGHYSDMVRQERLGVVIDPDQPETWSRSIEEMQTVLATSGVRERCRHRAQQLSWQAFLPQLQCSFSRTSRTAAE